MKDHKYIMDLRRAPILKILFPYVAGILLSQNLPLAFPWETVLIYAFVAFLIYVFGFFNYTGRGIVKPLHFLVFWGFFVFLGMANSKRDLYRQVFFDRLAGHLQEAEGYIYEEGKERGDWITYTLVLQKGRMGNQEVTVHEKIYLSLPKEETAFPKLFYGDKIRLKTNLKRISGPKNEGEFDYQRFSKRRGISFQQYAQAEEVQLLEEKGGCVLMRYARALRHSVIQQYEEYIGNTASVEIVSALVLGYRNDLSSEAFDLFSNTGTIHVLSVSGMHVGIIFGVILFLLYPLPRVARLLLSLVLVWLYAVFAGLAPSVLRASLMISIYVISRLFYLQNNTLQVVSLTAFLLLLASPQFLYEVGFQLSFLAVLGILWVYPLLKRMYYPAPKISRRILDLLYISMAAQLFTVPFTLYYFHYFPNFFLLANILVVFPASVIMVLGLLLPTLPFVLLKSWIGLFLLWITEGIWIGLETIYGFPFSKTSGVFLSRPTVVLLYALLITVLLMLYTFKKRNVKLFFITLLLFLSYRMVEKLSRQHRTELRIYNVGQGLAISYIEKGRVFLTMDKDRTTPSRVYRSVYPHLQKYIDMEKYEPVSWDGGNANIAFKEDVTLSIWEVSPSFSSVSGKGMNWVLIRNQSFPERWLREGKMAGLKPVLFVFDASNSDFYIDRISAELEKYQIGYYVLKNNFTYVWSGDNNE